MGTAHAANICAGWGACDTVTLSWSTSRGVLSTDTSSFQDDSGYTDSTSMHIGDYTGIYAMTWNTPATTGMITAGAVDLAWDFWCYEDTTTAGYNYMRWDYADNSGAVITITTGYHTTNWHHWQSSGSAADVGQEVVLAGRTNRMQNGAGFILLDSVWAEPTVPVEDWYMY